MIFGTHFPSFTKVKVVETVFCFLSKQLQVLSAPTFTGSSSCGCIAMGGLLTCVAGAMMRPAGRVSNIEWIVKVYTLRIQLNILCKSDYSLQSYSADGIECHQSYSREGVWILRENNMRKQIIAKDVYYIYMCVCVILSFFLITSQLVPT